MRLGARDAQVEHGRTLQAVLRRKPSARDENDPLQNRQRHVRLSGCLPAQVTLAIHDLLEDFDAIKRC